LNIALIYFFAARQTYEASRIEQNVSAEGLSLHVFYNAITTS